MRAISTQPRPVGRYARPPGQRSRAGRPLRAAVPATSHFTVKTVGGMTVYDLAKPKTGS